MIFASTANNDYYNVEQADYDAPVGNCFYKATVVKKTTDGFLTTNKPALLPVLQSRLVAA